MTVLHCARTQYPHPNTGAGRSCALALIRILASLLSPTRTSPQLPELPELPLALPVAVVPLSALPVPEFARGRERDDESDDDSVLGVPGPGLSDETRARVGRGSDRCRTSGGDFSVVLRASGCVLERPMVAGPRGRPRCGRSSRCATSGTTAPAMGGGSTNTGAWGGTISGS